MRAERIGRLLPEVHRRTIVPGTPIAALVDVMAELHAPVEDVLADLPSHFDPQRAPDRFVPFLAHWVDLARWIDDASGEFDTGVGRLRQVIAAAPRLSRRRGTAEGLREALEWALGVSGVRVDEAAADESGAPRLFHARVVLPREAAPHLALARRIVAQEKPAHVTVELVFADPGPGSADAHPEPGDEPAASDAPPTLPVGAPPSSPEPLLPGAEPPAAGEPPG